MKWIELLDGCSYEYDNTQLGFLSQNSTPVMSPLGVLCEFLNPNGMTLRTILEFDNIEIKDFVCDGEIFVVSPALMKRGKIKSPWMTHVVDDVSYNIYEAFDALDVKISSSNRPFSQVTAYIEQHYQQF